MPFILEALFLFSLSILLALAGWHYLPTPKEMRQADKHYEPYTEFRSFGEAISKLGSQGQPIKASYVVGGLYNPHVASVIKINAAYINSWTCALMARRKSPSARYCRNWRLPVPS
jgi:hypothetical protein